MGNAAGIHFSAKVCSIQYALCHCRCAGQGNALELIYLQYFILKKRKNVSKKIRQKDACVYLWLLVVLDKMNIRFMCGLSTWGLIVGRSTHSTQVAFSRGFWLSFFLSSPCHLMTVICHHHRRVLGVRTSGFGARFERDPIYLLRTFSERLVCIRKWKKQC